MVPSNIKDAAKEQFGREAQKYVTSQIHSSKSDLDFVVKFIEPNSDWSILDIATGTGHLALSLAPFVNKVIASDITQEMLEEAGKLAQSRDIKNFKTKEIDVHDIPLQNNSFDLVASRIAPHHFEDIEKAISEMTRVCRSGGYLFIQDTIAPENKDASDLFNKIEMLRDYSHVRDLSPSEWISLLESNGTTLVKKFEKQKNWPLRWWTERMSTPKEKVEMIIEMLEENFEDYKERIGIQRSENYLSDNFEERLDSWSLHPKNGYFLMRKK